MLKSKRMKAIRIGVLILVYTLVKIAFKMTNINSEM